MLVFDVSKKYYTIAGYLEMEDASDTRHEFENGTITELAGGILPHNAIKLRLSGTLDRLLDSQNVPHMALNSDTKVRIEAHNRFVYPDLTISDGTPEYYTTPEGVLRRDIITNPLVIFEVLSKDTRNYDKGDKFDLYSSIPSFREYVLIEPETVWVKSIFLQDPDNDLFRQKIFTNRNDTLTVHSLGISISLNDIYAALDKLPKV